MPCDLATLGASGRLHLVSAIDDHQHALTVHWVRHYVSVGVPPPSFQLHIFVRDRKRSDVLVGMLHAEGVHNLSLVFNAMVGGDIEHVRNKALADLPGDHYLIAPDVDEFYEYDCDLGLNQRDAWCAMMRDRLAPDGKLARVELQPSLAEQFPHLCYVRQHLRPMSTQKPILVRVATLPTGGRKRAAATSSHGRKYGSRVAGKREPSAVEHRAWFDGPHVLRSLDTNATYDRPCPIVGYFSHFTMTTQQREILRRKMGYGNHYTRKDYEKIHSFMNLAETHDVRHHAWCRPDNFQLAAMYWPACSMRTEGWGSLCVAGENRSAEPVPLSQPPGKCDVEVENQKSEMTHCIKGETFGADGSGAVWIQGGCRGVFRCCDGAVVHCGHRGMPSENRTVCQCR